jgi:hypothetical protein
MRLPWSKPNPRRPEAVEFEDRSAAALAGSDGDGKDHDLQYWLDSGFLTLPRPDSDVPVSTESDPT